MYLQEFELPQWQLALIECAKSAWTLHEDRGNVQFVKSTMFDDTLNKMLKQLPRLSEKLTAFMQLKSEDPIRPISNSDKPFSSEGPIGRALPKLRYIHLGNDVILFYEIEGREPTTIKLYGVFNHDELGIGQPTNIKKQKSVVQRLARA